MTVKMGAPMPPNPMMPRQPMNMLPPPMPVPAINQPMPMQQGAAPVPVNARRRKRFGDSLENMLSRPPMVASDQMANMNVFTGQMMNTAARPPVVRMRGGGNVGQMYSQAYSSPAFKSFTESKKNTFAPTAGTPGRTVKTHDEIMASIRGGSSPNDDKPAPVVVTRDDDYTPTSAELAQQLSNQGLTDMRSDTSATPELDMIKSGSDIMNPDRRDEFNQDMVDRSARIAARNMRSAGGFSDVEMAPGTGGIAAMRSRQPYPDELSLQTPFDNTPSIPSTPVGSGMNPANVYVDPLDPFGGPGPDVSSLVSQATLERSMGLEPFGGASMNMDYLDPRNDFGPTNVAPLSAANINLPEDVANALSNLGLGDPNAKSGGAGGGQTGTGSGEKDDRTIVQKLIDDFAAVPGNVARDIAMAIDAGFYGTSYEKARENLRNAKNPDGSRKYTDAQIEAWVAGTKDRRKEQQMAQGQSTDDDSPMSTSPVDPCPEGFKLDPVSRICVPIEEAEEEGPSLSLNRTRDDEFSELDDLMGKIVKPVGDTDEVRTMQAGGSVGLNRAADNFLAAMGA